MPKVSMFYGIMRVFLAVMLMAITVLTFYQIVMRYVFNMAPSWSEELVRFLFVWLSFVGAGMGVRDRIHIGVDAFIRILPAIMQYLAAILVAVIISVFGVFLIFSSWNMIVMTHSQPSPALGIPMSYVYLALPALGFLMVVYGLDNLWTLLKTRNYKYGEGA